MSPGRSKWALLGALFLVLVVADQWTKYLAVERLTTVFERSGEGSTATSTSSPSPPSRTTCGTRSGG